MYTRVTSRRPLAPDTQHHSSKCPSRPRTPPAGIDFNSNPNFRKSKSERLPTPPIEAGDGVAHPGYVPCYLWCILTCPLAASFKPCRIMGWWIVLSVAIHGEPCSNRDHIVDVCCGKPNNITDSRTAAFFQRISGRGNRLFVQCAFFYQMDCI